MSKPRKRLKVSATSPPQKVAGAIAKYLTVDHEDIEIIAVGAGAVNQAIKAQILARRFTSSAGINLSFIPAFETLEIDEKEVTAIKWIPVS